jgi:hypothetical protein
MQDNQKPHKRQRRQQRQQQQQQQQDEEGGQKKMASLMCREADGNWLPIHEADLVLMSYEQLREQLTASIGG